MLLLSRATYLLPQVTAYSHFYVQTAETGKSCR